MSGNEKVASRMERAIDGEVREHTFYDGYDLWGYDEFGSYNGAYDRAPFQSSPFWVKSAMSMSECPFDGNNLGLDFADNGDVRSHCPDCGNRWAPDETYVVSDSDTQANQ